MCKLTLPTQVKVFLACVLLLLSSANAATSDDNANFNNLVRKEGNFSDIADMLEKQETWDGQNLEYLISIAGTPTSIESSDDSTKVATYEYQGAEEPSDYCRVYFYIDKNGKVSSSKSQTSVTGGNPSSKTLCSTFPSKPNTP